MTKKDYELVASSIKEVVNMYDEEAKDILSILVEYMKTKFGYDNPKFDGIKFRKACGL
jgi:hypothetical protein